MDAFRHLVDHLPVVMAAAMPLAFALQLVTELWSWSERSDPRPD